MLFGRRLSINGALAGEAPRGEALPADAPLVSTGREHGRDDLASRPLVVSEARAQSASVVAWARGEVDHEAARHLGPRDKRAREGVQRGRRIDAMGTHQTFDPFLEAPVAERVRQLCAERGAYGVYVEGPVEHGFGAGMVRRHDAAMNHLMTGGRFGRHEDPSKVMSRINLFRSVFFEHSEVQLPGIEPVLESSEFASAAAELTGRPLVRPTMLYANILLPGQELPLHTDTPEYRGLDKWKVPEWFLVVMHHSGLFESHRKHVTAGVAFFNDCEGGDFVFYPDGPDAAPATVSPRFNTAIHLDVDGTFHGVDRVGGDDAPPPPVEPGATLTFSDADERWHLAKDGEELASYGWPEVRLSVQWKANCYRDEDEVALVASGADALTQEAVIDRLVDDLRARGRIDERPDDDALARLLVEAYVRFPGA